MARDMLWHGVWHVPYLRIHLLKDGKVMMRQVIYPHHSPQSPVLCQSGHNKKPDFKLCTRQDSGNEIHITGNRLLVHLHSNNFTI